MRMRMLMPAFLIIGFMLLLFACAQNEAMRNAEQSAAPVSATGKHVEVDFSQSCYDCHLNTSPEIVAKWETGKHGQVNVGCFVCHGDGEEEFFAKPQGERCSGCHSAKEVNFAALPVKNCFGCHGGHDLKFHQAD